MLFIFGILINQLQEGEAAARRVPVVDLEPEIYDKEDAIELNRRNILSRIQRRIFYYPKTTVPVLSGISFKAEAEISLV